MINKLVSVRLSSKLEKESNQIVSEFGFSNLQELIRVALIEKVQSLKREIALVQIQKLKGSMKKVTPLSKAQRNKLAKEFLR